MRTVRCSSRRLGGVWPEAGVCARGVSAWGCLPDIHPVNRMVDACENITLRTVIKSKTNDTNFNISGIRFACVFIVFFPEKENMKF